MSTSTESNPEGATKEKGEKSTKITSRWRHATHLANASASVFNSLVEDRRVSRTNLLKLPVEQRDWASLTLLDEVFVSVPQLKRFTKNARYFIAKEAKYHSFKKGEFICRSGERCDCAYIIVSGEAVVCDPENSDAGPLGASAGPDCNARSTTPNGGKRKTLSRGACIGPSFLDPAWIRQNAQATTGVTALAARAASGQTAGPLSGDGLSPRDDVATLSRATQPRSVHRSASVSTENGGARASSSWQGSTESLSLSPRGRPGVRRGDCGGGEGVATLSSRFSCSLERVSGGEASTSAQAWKGLAADGFRSLNNKSSRKPSTRAIVRGNASVVSPRDVAQPNSSSSRDSHGEIDSGGERRDGFSGDERRDCGGGGGGGRGYDEEATVSGSADASRMFFGLQSVSASSSDNLSPCGNSYGNNNDSNNDGLFRFGALLQPPSVSRSPATAARIVSCISRRNSRAISPGANRWTPRSPVVDVLVTGNAAFPPSPPDTLANGASPPAPARGGEPLCSPLQKRTVTHSPHVAHNNNNNDDNITIISCTSLASIPTQEEAACTSTVGDLIRVAGNGGDAMDDNGPPSSTSSVLANAVARSDPHPPNTRAPRTARYSLHSPVRISTASTDQQNIDSETTTPWPPDGAMSMCPLSPSLKKSPTLPDLMLSTKFGSTKLVSVRPPPLLLPASSSALGPVLPSPRQTPMSPNSAQLPTPRSSTMEGFDLRLVIARRNAARTAASPRFAEGYDTYLLGCEEKSEEAFGEAEEAKASSTSFSPRVSARGMGQPNSNPLRSDLGDSAASAFALAMEESGGPCASAGKNKGSTSSLLSLSQNPPSPGCACERLDNLAADHVYANGRSSAGSHQVLATARGTAARPARSPREGSVLEGEHSDEFDALSVSAALTADLIFHWSQTIRAENYMVECAVINLASLRHLVCLGGNLATAPKRHRPDKARGAEGSTAEWSTAPLSGAASPGKDLAIAYRIAEGPKEEVGFGVHLLPAARGRRLQFDVYQWSLGALMRELQAMPVMAPLHAREVFQLARVVRSVTYSPGEVIYLQDSLGDELFIIAHGYVRFLQRVLISSESRGRIAAHTAKVESLVAHFKQLAGDGHAAASAANSGSRGLAGNPSRNTGSCPARDPAPAHAAAPVIRKEGVVANGGGNGSVPNPQPPSGVGTISPRRDLGHVSESVSLPQPPSPRTPHPPRSNLVTETLSSPRVSRLRRAHGGGAGGSSARSRVTFAEEIASFSPPAAADNKSNHPRPRGVPPLSLQTISSSQSPVQYSAGGAGATSSPLPLAADSLQPLPEVPPSTAPAPTSSEAVFVEMGLLGPGQCFGETSTSSDRRRTASATADTRVLVLVASRRELYQFLDPQAFNYLWNLVPSDAMPPLPIGEAAAAAAAAQDDLIASLNCQLSASSFSFSVPPSMPLGLAGGGGPLSFVTAAATTAAATAGPESKGPPPRRYLKIASDHCNFLPGLSAGLLGASKNSRSKADMRPDETTTNKASVHEKSTLARTPTGAYVMIRTPSFVVEDSPFNLRDRLLKESLWSTRDAMAGAAPAPGSNLSRSATSAADVEGHKLTMMNPVAAVAAAQAAAAAAGFSATNGEAYVCQQLESALSWDLFKKRLTADILEQKKFRLKGLQFR